MWDTTLVLVLMAGIAAGGPKTRCSRTRMPHRTIGVQRRSGRREELCVVDEAEEVSEATVRPRGFKKRLDEPSPAARVVSGVFGVVGLTNRRVSRVLHDLGHTLDAVAERAESMSQLVHHAGRRPVVIERPELEEEPMPPNTTDPAPELVVDEPIPVAASPWIASLASSAASFVRDRLDGQPWWAVALAFYVVGRGDSWRRRLALGALALACLLAPHGTQNWSSGARNDRNRASVFVEEASAVRETLSWLHWMNEAAWRAGGPTKGLGPYLAKKARRLVVEGLAESFGSSLRLVSLEVDLGAEPPRLKRAARLRETPRFLADAMGPSGSIRRAFVVELDEWQITRPFVRADVALTNSMKYAVPRIGLVLDRANVSRSAAVMAVDFVPEYPFVKMFAIAFLADDVPALTTRALVGATADADLFDFEPFARLVDDELKNNLPVAPRAYAFDLGDWLTDCGPAREPSPPANPQPPVLKEHDLHEAGWRRRRRRRADDDRGLLARLRDWAARKKKQPPPRPLEPPPLPLPPGSAGLQDRETETKRRLDAERRKLLEAAGAVRRERDKLVAAARSTQQALSDRFLVAFKVQLAEELHSLGTVLFPSRRAAERNRRNKTPPIYTS